MFSWPRVWESNVIGRPPFGLDGIQYFLGRGGGGVPVGVEGRGEGREPLPTFKPRPPTRIHRSSKQTTLSTTAQQSKTSRTSLVVSLPYPPIPPSASQSTRASHPNPIFRSRCRLPTLQPTFYRPNHRRDPRQIRSERTYLPNPKPYRFDSNLPGILDVSSTPIILDTSDQTTSPTSAAGLLLSSTSPATIQSTSGHDQNHTPYQA